jgi:hypothetical protein
MHPYAMTVLALLEGLERHPFATLAVIVLAGFATLAIWGARDRS